MKRAIDHYKARGLDFSKIFYRPETAPGRPSARRSSRTTASTRRLDQELLPLAAPALERGEPVEIEMPIRNVNRTVGTILGSELTRKYGAAGLPDDTIRLRFPARPARASARSCPGG